MTLLTQTDRDRLIAQLQRVETAAAAFTKPELAAACAAADQWVEDNQAGYNAALPAAFRTKATTAQKAILLGYVLWRRIGRLVAEEDRG